MRGLWYKTVANVCTENHDPKTGRDMLDNNQGTLIIGNLNMKRFIVIGASIVGVLLLLSAGAWYFYMTEVLPKTGTADATEEYQTAITNLNRTFSTIYSTVDPSDSEGVRQALEVAANNATNPIERGTLLLTLAQLTTTGNVANGVLLHKAIVADTMLTDEIRAAALINLAFIYYSETSDADSLTKAIFTNEKPYSDMRPKDTSERETERAYTSLLLYAETFHPTLLANGYIARFWAEEALVKTALGLETSVDIENTKAHIARIEWLRSQTTYLSEDLNLPMSTLLQGIAELYLAGASNASTEIAIEHINEGLPALGAASARLLAEYEGNETTGPLVKDNINQTTHGIWIDILEAAVAVMDAKPEAATTIADMYATYINSPEGYDERTRAISNDAELTALITSLEPLSDSLKEAI